MACRIRRQWILLVFLLGLGLFLSGCNLGAAPDPEQSITAEPTNTPRTQATRTPVRDVTQPTNTPLILPTSASTSVVVLPPPAFTLVPTNTPQPISVTVLSPVPGSVVAGNVQVLGSAIHPDFLQYRLEFGQDPNPGNLWFPITGIVQAPVLNGSLGIWNTNTPASPDGVYQLRLRVFLRDGRQQATVVNGIRVRNQQPTPIPSNTPPIPRPVAAFTQDITQGEAPLVVRFTNQSQGQITSYSWDFGDTGNSNVPNPIHTFSQPGIYTVILRVAGPGGTANVSRQITVSSPDAPSAAFEPTVSSGEAPLQVRFINQSVGNISGYTWDFGDGSPISTATSPTHTFASEGTYNVILEVRGPGGTSTAVRQITVENPQVPPPVAGFIASPSTGQVPLTVSFSNTTTGQATQYLWDFNTDGITDSAEFEPTFVYTHSGTFTARLTAIGQGGQSTATREISVLQPPDAPRAAFNVSPTSGDAPLRVEFTNTTTGDATSYAWDFETDGRIDTNAVNPIHTYTQPGTYTAALTATGAGGSTTATQQITVTQPLAAPEANFEANPTLGEAPLTVQFTNTSEGAQLNFLWNFGDGSPANNTSNPSHIYEEQGNYTVTLTVSNPAGSDTASQTINVSEAVVQLPPTAAFQAAPQAGFAPLTVNFTNQSFGDIQRYEWDFDDNGTVDSTQTSPSFVYQQAGEYLARLTAFGPGGSNSITTPISVQQLPPPPQAQFAPNTTSGEAPLTVTFAITSQSQFDSFAWDFNGDGITDNTSNNPAQFTYQQPGEYDASLTLTNAAGADTTTQRITVNPQVIAPVADFSAQPTSGTAPLTVNFAVTSQSQYDNLSWDFNGDGVPDNTTDPQVSFTYQQPGSYNPTLTLTNSAGSDTSAQAITVNELVIAPVAAFSAQPTSGTAPLTVNFAVTSQSQYDNLSWDFNGDGVPDNTTDAQISFTYQQPGQYNPTLTLSNSAGSDTSAQAITVNELVIAPVADFSAQPTSGTAPLTVNFAVTSQSQYDNLSWDFNGDGVPDNTTDAQVSFTYQQPGTYNPTLTLSNSAGSDTSAQAITVNELVIAPVADFSAQPTIGTAPLTVNFAITSQSQFDSFAWDFNGDGITDNTSNNPAQFTYQQPGEYDASLTLTNAAGADTTTQRITVNPQVIAPVADFSAQPTSGTAPLTVNFAVTSQSQYDTLSWDFNGDGVPDNTTDAQVSFTYQQPGTYNPTLTLSNSAGSDTSAQAITVNELVIAPVADFSAQPTSGTAPLTVNFAITSQSQFDSFAWDFNGDGITDNTSNNPAQFTYQQPGEYDASLTLTNAAGADTTTQRITVNPQVIAPVAAFSAQPTTGTAPLTVNFAVTSQSQYDTLSWDFNGDGVPDNTTDAQVSFTYQQPGSYNPTLTLSNSAGSDTSAQAISVEQQVIAPVADFSAQPTSGTAPLTVNFAVTSQSQYDSLSWDFNGDGVPDNTTDPQVSFTYQQPGTYNPTLTLSNSAGSDTSAQAITVEQQVIAPVADFSAQPTSGTAPLTVNFAITSQSQYDSFSWDFNGDGVPDNTSDAQVSFTYQQPGSYNPTLTLSNSAGSDTISRAITVEQQQTPPVAEFNAQPNTGTAPLTVNFSITSQSQYDSLSWDFNGDGVPDNTTDAQVSFTYQQAGNYSAGLTLTNAAGSDTVFVTIIVTEAQQPPTASFTAEPVSGLAPLNVTFTDTSTGTVESRAWDFNGDGVPDNTSDAQVSFTYQQPGTYNATLTVNGANTQDTATQQIIVSQRQQLAIGSIVFTSDVDGNTEIYSVNADGSGLGNLTNNDAADLQPAWASNGGSLAFVSNRNGDNDIFLLDPRRFSVTPVITDPSNDRQPAWQPNTLRFAFVSDRNGDNDIFIVNADGSQLTPLITDPSNDQQPAWSPDGSTLAFVSDRSGTQQIYTVTVNADGSIGQVTQLTSGNGNNSQPDWSPDGTQIAFTSDRNGNRDVFVISADGSNQQPLTTNQADDQHPRWSPDGTQLVITSNRAGDADLYILQADGSNITRLVQQPGNQTDADWR